MSQFDTSQKEVNELKASQAPPLSPDTLGLGQQQMVLAALEFIVILGISPNLQQGVGIPVKKRSQFGKLVSNINLHSIHEEEKIVHLLTTLKVLVTCLHCSALGPLILSRHLSDVLASLLQLIHVFRTKKPLRDVKGSGENGDKKQKESTHQDSTCESRKADGETMAAISEGTAGNPEGFQFCDQSLSYIVNTVPGPSLVRELMVLQAGSPSQVYYSYFMARWGTVKQLSRGSW